MAFEPLINRRGAPSHKNRVTCLSAGRDVLAIMLSEDLCARYGIVSGRRLRIDLGTGSDHGKLRVTPARASDTACVATFQRNRKVGFNIREAHLPDVKTPRQSTLLPHTGRDDGSIVIDLSPLKSASNTTTEQP